MQGWIAYAARDAVVSNATVKMQRTKCFDMQLQLFLGTKEGLQTVTHLCILALLTPQQLRNVA